MWGAWHIAGLAGGGSQGSEPSLLATVFQINAGMKVRLTQQKLSLNSKFGSF